MAAGAGLRSAICGAVDAHRTWLIRSIERTRNPIDAGLAGTRRPGRAADTNLEV